MFFNRTLYFEEIATFILILKKKIILHITTEYMDWIYWLLYFQLFTKIKVRINSKDEITVFDWDHFHRVRVRLFCQWKLSKLRVSDGDLHPAQWVDSSSSLKIKLGCCCWTVDSGALTANQQQILTWMAQREIDKISITTDILFFLFINTAGAFPFRRYFFTLVTEKTFAFYIIVDISASGQEQN